MIIDQVPERAIIKTITILLMIAMTGCTTLKQTTHQAKTDWNNFTKIIRFNQYQPVVYKNSYF
jgi:hypothetical protein